MTKKRIDTEERNKLIAARYAELLSADVSPDDAIQKIADEHDIGKFYVRGILRASGIRIDRKGQYDRKDNLSDRDRQIIELAEKGSTPEEIGERFDITPTRVRQVVRDNVADLKKVRIERTLTEIKNDVNEYSKAIESDLLGNKGKKGYLKWKDWYKKIVTKYGEKSVREIKSNLGYNLFKETQKLRDDNIISMGKLDLSATEASEKHGLCKDYIYGIWHSHGIHKDTKKKKMSKEQRAARDKKIKELAKTKKIGDIAKEFDLSYTMVKLIVNPPKKK